MTLPLRASSSVLGTFSRHCPRAIDHMEDGSPRDGDIFEAGTAAHAVMDRVHRAALEAGRILLDAEVEAVANTTLTALTTQGRMYKGRQEPPLDLERARMGRSLALGYLGSVGNALPLQAHPEVALAVNRRWEPVPWDSEDVWYSGILDCVSQDEDDFGWQILRVTDYKTAWPAGGELTGSLQMRGYLLLAMAHASTLFPDADFELLDVEIVNLRLRRSWVESFQSEELDDETLAGWQSEIDAMISAIPRRPKGGHRPASPGPRCMACMYRQACTASPDVDDQSLARRHAYLLAELDVAERDLRMTTSHRPIEMDGQALGWSVAKRNTPTPKAAQMLADLYCPGADIPPGIITLLRKVLTAGGVTKALTILRGPGAKEDRAPYLEQCLTEKVGRRWGWSPLDDS